MPKKLPSLLCICLSMLLTLISCGEDHPTKPPFVIAIHGTVTDSQGHPISGAVVKTDPSSEECVTKSDGKYRIDEGLTEEGLENRTYITLFVTASGYAPYETELKVEEVRGTEGLTWDIKLYTYTITGRVVDTSGNPIPGVTIRTEPETDTRHTDSDGRYEIKSGIAPGEYTVTATKDGYFPQSEKVRVAETAEVGVADITLKQIRIGIQGIVKDADTGDPISGVTITAEPLARGETDSEGRYTLADLTSDTDYKVTATKPGYESVTITVHVRAGETYQSGNIQLHKVEPILSLSADSLDFGAERGSILLSIENSGTGTLIWTITIPSSDTWLNVDQPEGDVTTQAVVVDVNVDRTGLKIGEYTSHIVVTSNGGNSTIPVLMRVEKPPELVVSPSSLDFGETLSSKTITIGNLGSGTLNWNASSGQSWISITPDSGSITTEAATITVTVNREGLSAGTHNGSVDITSNGGDRSVTVQMTVPQPPELSVDMTSLNFDKDKTTLSFHISNTGKGTLNWEISVSQGWLTVTPQSGTITDASQEITAIVDRSGLSPGNYGGVISIASNGGDQSVNVSMEVPSPPELKVVPNTLNFETGLTSLTFHIINAGDGALIWDISEDIAWLELSSYSGTTTAETDPIEVIVDRKGLPREPGTYEGRITVNSPTDTSVVEVIVIVPSEPTLAVSAIKLDLGTEGTKRTFVITNAGTGTLTWNISADQDWIALDPESGTTAEETDEITVTVDRRDMTLESSPYIGTISITSGGGDREIEVKVTVPAVPTLYCEPAEIHFAEDEIRQTLHIRNSGTGTLTWSLSEEIDWLTLSPTSGTTATETDEVMLTANRSGLSYGTYSGTITVTSDGGDQTIPVRMDVPETPVLSVDVDNLDFGESKPQIIFHISNVGTGTLDWSSTDNREWLTVLPNSGAAATEPSAVTVTVDRAGLTVGTHTGAIYITSDGGGKTVGVSVTVSPVPVLSYRPVNIVFGEESTSAILYIANSGTGTLKWSIAEDIAWLSLSSTSGTSTGETDEVVLTADRSGLTEGTYDGEIQITSGGGEASIPVSITVPPPPVLVVNVASLDFGKRDSVLSFTIANAGGGGLTWRAASAKGWLSVDPSEGTIRTEMAEITVTVDRTGLVEGSIYTAILTVSSNGGEQNIPVRMEVPTIPVLSVVPTSFDFGEEDTSGVLRIRNAGMGRLTWSITEDLDWVTLSPTSGTTTTETDEATLTAAREGLTPGEYSGVIRITSDGGNATIQVEMTIPQPSILTVSTQALDFGDTETTQTFEITNTGGGKLTWSVTDDREWLSVTPDRGTTRTEQDRLTVTVDRSGMAVGAYEGTLTMLSDGGQESVGVRMTVPDMEAPTVSITSPVDGDTVSVSAEIVGEASDNVGVSKVEFYVDEALRGTDDTSPYLYVWDTSSEVVDHHTLAAKAYDEAGNEASSTITVVVPDREAPTVEITAPQSGVTVSHTITVVADASDNIGVVKVEFYLGDNLAFTDEAEPYAYQWDTFAEENDTYSIQAKAYDAAGHVGTSDVVTVTVFNDKESPVVSITSPADGDSVSGSVEITADASDYGGVSKVEFYVDGIRKGTDTNAPYAYIWNTTHLGVRHYVLMAKAYDDEGNTGVDSVTVKVVKMGDIEVTGEFEDNTGNIEVTGEFATRSGGEGGSGNVEVTGEMRKVAGDSLGTGAVEVTGAMRKAVSDSLKAGAVEVRGAFE